MAESLSQTDELFASVLNGTASARVIDELNRVLRSDASHRRRFMQMTRINIALNENYNASPIMTAGGRVDSDSIVLDARIEEEPAAKRLSLSTASYAIAAALLWPADESWRLQLPDSRVAAGLPQLPPPKPFHRAGHRSPSIV